MNIKDFLHECREGIRSPKSYRDIHLLVFFLQFIILLICSLGLYYVVSETDPKLKEGGIVHSYISAFRIEEDDKTFCELLDLMNEDEEHIVHTDKFYDSERGGLWLSNKQKALVVSLWFGLIPAAIIYLFLGLGSFYAQIRKSYFSAIVSTAGFMLFPPVGLAIWAFISLFFFFAVCSLAGLLLPIPYLLHLVVGIYQLIAKKK